MKILVLLLLFIGLNAFELLPTKFKYKIEIIKEEGLSCTIDGNKLSEISDLAYDKNSSILYMISDKGILFTFNAKFTNTEFSLKPMHSYRIKDRDGNILKDSWSDSEGMTFDKEGNLYISFERITKIFQFTKKGNLIKEVKLPKELENVELSSANKSLESLAWHKKYGFITALEYPKEGLSRINQTIYSTSGKIWQFKMEDIARNGIAEIEVMDDGNLLVLERAFNWFIGDFEVNLVKVFINEPQDGKFCRKEVVAKLKINSFFNMENFEGLTNLGDGKYLLISDDNSNFLAVTKLVYFKITKE